MSFHYKYLDESFDLLEIGSLAPESITEYVIGIWHDELASIEIEGVFLGGSDLNKIIGWHKKWPTTGIAISFPDRYGDFMDYVWVTNTVGDHYSRPLPAEGVEWNDGYILQKGDSIGTAVSNKKYDIIQDVIGSSSLFAYKSYVKLAANPSTFGIHVGAADTATLPLVEIFDSNQASIYQDSHIVYGRLEAPLLNEADFTGITSNSSLKVFFYYDDGIEKPYTFSPNANIIIRATEDIRTTIGDELKIKIKIVVPEWANKIETLKFNLDTVRK